jgi:Spy/CpxP family protein refolding chaperone
MSKRNLLKIPFLLVCVSLMSSVALAQGFPGKKDVFKGKLFAPNIILEHQDDLGLTKEQFTAIKAAVVDVQANVAEHEWDLREAYMQTLSSLDESPIDEEQVMKNVEAALRAENQVKQLQVRMLIRLRKLLTDEQVEYLQAQRK